jgi:hypothetical protein
MVEELKGINVSSPKPTISLGSIIWLLAFGGVFGWIAVWPFAPPFDSLLKEDAYVQRVRTESWATTTTRLITGSGRTVKCGYSKTGGCHPATMKLLMENKTPVIVWHNGASVFQLATHDRMILSYEHFHEGGWFAGVVSITFLLVAFIQIAIRKGWIGMARP